MENPFNYPRCIQHFLHHHPLHLTSPDQALNVAPCSGCSNLQHSSSGWTYRCNPCNFTLHISCAPIPQQMNHPAHPSHPLILHLIPAYTCNLCNRPGNSSSYRCNHCNFDLHLACALTSPSPPRANNMAHGYGHLPGPGPAPSANGLIYGGHTTNNTATTSTLPYGQPQYYHPNYTPAPGANNLLYGNGPWPGPTGPTAPSTNGLAQGLFGGVIFSIVQGVAQSAASVLLGDL